MKRSIERTTNIFDEGAHSLIILQAITRISKTFNQRLSFNTIYAHKTIEELALLIATNTDSDKRIIPINTHKSGNENLFLLPSSVGSSSVFSNFKLAESQNLWGLDYHSISKEDTQTIAALAMALHQEITRVDDSLTITLLGYSMGAYVALETARILEKEGKSPQLILVDVNLNPSGKRISNLKEDERLNEIKQEFGSLLTNYSPVPLSSTPIVALEAKENSLSTNMQQWRTYGSSFVHDYLEGDHDSVFSKANISTAILKVENALNTFTARRVQLISNDFYTHSS
jgi:pimeloyl-ACP methyl ester carboxylesterase